MNYITTKDAANNWKITDRMVLYHCSIGRVKEAKKIGNTWFVTVDTEKTADVRYRNIKVKDGENK